MKKIFKPLIFKMIIKINNQIYNIKIYLINVKTHKFKIN